MQSTIQWKDLRLSYKFGIAIGFFGLLMIGIIFFFDHTLVTTRHAFHKIRTTESALEVHAKAIHTKVLNCRRHEKNFFLRFDTSYLTKVKNHAKAIIEELNTIEKMATENNLPEVIGITDQLLKDMDIYLAGFTNIVQTWEKVGLT
ncbi:MAG: hypothetical protein MI749_00665, partial [Desulfovibrionales bacterium]|nr:hypothetical protein [Desulfovibrionales bacterium]